MVHDMIICCTLQLFTIYLLKLNEALCYEHMMYYNTISIVRTRYNVLFPVTLNHSCFLLLLL